MRKRGTKDHTWYLNISWPSNPFSSPSLNPKKIEFLCLFANQPRYKMNLCVVLLSLLLEFSACVTEFELVANKGIAKVAHPRDQERKRGLNAPSADTFPGPFIAFFFSFPASQSAFLVPALSFRSLSQTCRVTDLCISSVRAFVELGRSRSPIRTLLDCARILLRRKSYEIAANSYFNN